LQLRAVSYILTTSGQDILVYNSCGAQMLSSVKIAYHCFLCNENFTDIEAAKGHCKSFTHEVVERVQGAGGEGKSLLI
jgi:hypothetical protein